MESTATALRGGMQTERMMAASFVFALLSKLLEEEEEEGEIRSGLLKSSDSIGGNPAQEPTDNAAGYTIADGEEKRKGSGRRDKEGSVKEDEEKGYPESYLLKIWKLHVTPCIA